ncbi:cysteine--tRNA ligase, partial [Candidatus Woesearchaeota archaeon]|nr:cysteine--tRNA ligase [Candidatus Woesearchaeota archaeon]
MPLQLYNTLTRKKEVFRPIDKGTVRMYNCGPTVYDYPHIGNCRAFLLGDLLRRYLEFKGLNVNQVMNITDVDDKTIRDSQKEGVSLKEFTERYTKAFMDDLASLNVKPATTYPKATEHIKDMVELVSILLDKGIAYKAEDGIYFDVSKFKGYGKLAHINLEELKAGASERVKSDEYAKDKVQDFALWKAWDKDDGDVFWETEVGKGRPGWHIECSAMSRKYLGQPFDIHTGGIDLVFPHHENEIAQSEAAYGKKFVNYWVHNEFILVEGKKMSKSLGNFFTLRDLIQKGHDPFAIRYSLISAHYRQQLNFTIKGLEAAKQSVQRLQDCADKLRAWESDTEDNQDIPDLVKLAIDGFEAEMDDDLNISNALAIIFEFVKNINKLMLEGKLSTEDAKNALELLQRFDAVLGVLKHEEQSLDEDIQALVEEREEARKNKDYEKADKIRDELKEKGIILEDTSQGVRW